MKRGIWLPLLCAVGVLVFLALQRRRGRRPNWTPPPATSRLRLADEIRPLYARWLELDSKLASFKAGQSPDPDLDWAALIREAMALVTQSAQMEQHFARDMGGLQGMFDPVTGRPHAEVIERVYGQVDALGRCVLSSGGLVYQLHRMSSDHGTSLLKEYRKKAGEYQKLRADCLKAGPEIDALYPSRPTSR